MLDGFIKVAAATPDLKVADCAYNMQSMIALIDEAAQNQVKLLVFPELGLTGYTCGDLLMTPHLQRGAMDALLQVMHYTKGIPMLVIAGLPVVWENNLYNCAAVLYQGRILGIIPKTYIPNYNEFYEARQFASAPAQTTVFADSGPLQGVPFGTKLLFCCEEIADFVFGVEICEDLWAPAPPSTGLAGAGASVIVNLSASNETVGKKNYRKQLVAGQSARLVCGYVYASAGEGESTTDLVFSGHNLIAENGVLLAQNALYETGLLISELDVSRILYERRKIASFPQADRSAFIKVSFSMPVLRTELTRPIAALPFIPQDSALLRQHVEDVLQMQAHGLKKRMTHTNAKTLVLGISGGLDSALALLVAVRAVDLLKLDRKMILAVTMPCFGTTARTRTNAEILCDSLGVTLKQIDIKSAVDVHFHDIGHDGEVHDVTYENAQARERTQVLMDTANLYGGLVIGTGDLSELALGWATYNGDHMSMYGVNSSIPKTLVRHLVAYEADRLSGEKARDALLDILDTPVSPELLPPKEGEIQQITEDLVGPYELHDFFLYYGIRWGFAPGKLYRVALYAFRESYEAALILKWLKVFYRRFFSQQFKRSCMPDGPKVGSVSLSPRGDWRMPSDASVSLWLKELETLR